MEFITLKIRGTRVKVSGAAVRMDLEVVLVYEHPEAAGGVNSTGYGAASATIYRRLLGGRYGGEGER